jgi:hypothetical protein
MKNKKSPPQGAGIKPQGNNTFVAIDRKKGFI